MAQDRSSSEAPSLDDLKDQFRGVLKSLGDSAVGSLSDRIGGITEKLSDVGEGGPVGKAAKKGGEEAARGGSPVAGALKGGLTGAKDKVKEAIPGLSGGGSGGGKGTKSVNIVESIDVGVPVSVAYNQWTQYEDWSDFMKKVETARQEDDEVEAKFKAQVFWSHRTWDATIIEQAPDERIVWRSEGEKGHVDGSVTFHELAPRLTRILVVLEYYPQGFMERTGNLWRAQGRRARLELKHFRRHVMMNTILEPDEVEGWRGEIHDEEVTRSHDEVVEEEEQESEDESGEDESGEDESGEEPEDEYDDEDEPDDEDEEEPEDEYDEEGEPDEDEPADEYDEDEEVDEEAEPEEEEEPPPPRRRRRR